MKKDDYLFYLKKALKGEIPPDRVKYHVEYYKRYIEEEIRNGRKPQDILDELGHPNMIAKSVIEAERMSGGASGHYEDIDDQDEVLNKAIKKFKRKVIIGLVITIVVFIAIIALISWLLLPALIVFGIVTIIRRLLR